MRDGGDRSRSHIRQRLWWAFPIAAIAALGGLVWSELQSADFTTAQAGAHDATAAQPAREPLDCDAGDIGGEEVFDYRIIDRQPNLEPGDPRDAAVRQLLGRDGELQATADEFVAGPRSADHSEQRLVRDGRLLAVASMKLEPGVGWLVNSLRACNAVLNDGSEPHG